MAAFIIKGRIRADIGLLDEAIFYQMLDGAIQCSRPKAQFSVGVCGDVAPDSVSMSLAVGEREEDMKHRWCQWHLLLRIRCRIGHLRSPLSTTDHNISILILIVSIWIY